ncbi:MAG: hypothetical protein KKC75_08315 [Nanoarchaeota archaeon]|nr:hypothetical protein [Nanoarchaeota archaeon]MBU1946517.1 hypothetical protein [Nanoarchaeota archaeon]
MADAQVFVKIDSYKDVLNTVGLIKDKLNEAKDTLSKLKDIKQREDAELDKWNSKLAEIESKVDGIDQILFQPASM